LSSGANIAAVPTPLQPVSGGFTWAETAISLILRDYRPAVSLFHDFWEMASRISYPRFRPRLAQSKSHGLFSENRETVQQQPISKTKAKSYRFQLVLKRRETVRNSRYITPGPRR
jgi:hypothetical protein